LLKTAGRFNVNPLVHLILTAITHSSGEDHYLYDIYPDFYKHNFAAVYLPLHQMLRDME
jgi:hypothetical protein